MPDRKLVGSLAHRRLSSTHSPACVSVEACCDRAATAALCSCDSPAFLACVAVGCQLAKSNSIRHLATNRAARSAGPGAPQRSTVGEPGAPSCGGLDHTPKLVCCDRYRRVARCKLHQDDNRPAAETAPCRVRRVADVAAWRRPYRRRLPRSAAALAFGTTALQAHHGLQALQDRGGAELL